MSTTQTPMAQSSTGTPSPSRTPDTSDPSTLLFAFLLSVLSIFVAFITFTVVLDRLVVRHHAINAVLPSGAPPDPPRLRRPEMWNIWVMPDKRPLPWLDIKVSKSADSDHDLAIDWLTFLASQWQLKDAIVLQVHPGLRRQSRPRRSGHFVY